MGQLAKPRVAVVSPFIDRSHGTELLVAEWMNSLADKFEIHLYSQSVRDVDPQKFVWHRIPKLPGPHLFNYCWWFVANQFWRAFDRHVRGLRYDVVYSPGINCFDADVISVHVVFAEYTEKNAANLRLSKRPLREWPALIHRKLYYRLIMFLERRIYPDQNRTLVLIAQKSSQELARCYGRNDSPNVIYVGINHEKFNTQRRMRLRAAARRDLGLAEDAFALILVGNDWRSKGFPVLLEALSQLKNPRIQLLLVSRENPEPIRAIVQSRKLEDCVHILPPRKDVEFYYAAADAYVGPSLEDSYALPPAEAMACGLPVIVSRANGTAEIISPSVDGLILENPTDATALAHMIRRLFEDAGFRAELGENAARTARQYTWERAGQQMNAIFEQVLRRKGRTAAETLARDF